ncbi:MAG: uroporphyrinogen-III synthase, partial [Longimicrobiales bacterium]|nr:uroporphyrinogen-III synthase [Longimicrobiales bacterium]
MRPPAPRGGLAGAVVVTTRAGEGDDPLSDALRAAGAEVRAWPTLRFGEPADPRALEAALAALDRWDWLAFTSPRAVQAVAARVGRPPEAPPGRWRVAAVGSGTADALRKAGWPVQLVGGDGGAEGLVEALARSGAPLTGARVLFLAGSLARTVLERGLAERGARVDRVEAYRTEVIPPDPERVRADLRRGVDAVLFASPSAVRGVDAALGGGLAGALDGVCVVAIGPTTAAELRRTGLHPRVAQEPSWQGLVAACRAGI